MLLDDCSRYALTKPAWYKPHGCQKILWLRFATREWARRCLAACAHLNPSVWVQALRSFTICAGRLGNPDPWSFAVRQGIPSCHLHQRDVLPVVIPCTFISAMCFPNWRIQVYFSSVIRCSAQIPGLIWYFSTHQEPKSQPTVHDVAKVKINIEKASIPALTKVRMLWGHMHSSTG